MVAQTVIHQGSGPTSPVNYSTWLSLHDVAAQCGVSAFAVRGWIVNGVGPRKRRVTLSGAKLGSRWRVSPDALTMFVLAATKAALPEGSPVHPVECETSQQSRELPGLDWKTLSTR